MNNKKSDSSIRNSKESSQRPRPEFRFTVEWERGEMQLIAEGKRLNLEIEGGRYYFPENPMAGSFETLEEAYLHVAGVSMEPPTNTGPSPFRIRKNFLSLGRAEKDLFADAMNCVYDSGWIAKAAKTHNRHAMMFHNAPQFLPWHRLFILKLEQELQRYEPDVMLPWWDPSNEGADSFDDEMLGEFFGGRGMNRGPFEHWRCQRASTTPTVNRGGQQISEKVNIIAHGNRIHYGSFHSFRRMEQSNSHTWAHDWVGGDMSRMTSPRDPLFWLHHCNVDRIWACWQRMHPQLPQYDTTPYDDEDANHFYNWDDIMEVGSLGDSSAPRAMLDHRSFGYAYAEDELLEEAWYQKFGTKLYSGDSPEMVISPRYWDFGAVNQGSIVYSTIALHNTLSVPVDVSLEWPTNTQNAFVWYPFIATFSPEERHELQVGFCPNSLGVHTDQMEFRVDTQGTSAVVAKVHLRGTCI